METLQHGFIILQLLFSEDGGDNEGKSMPTHDAEHEPNNLQRCCCLKTAALSGHTWRDLIAALVIRLLSINHPCRALAVRGFPRIHWIFGTPGKWRYKFIFLYLWLYPNSQQHINNLLIYTYIAQAGLMKLNYRLSSIVAAYSGVSRSSGADTSAQTCSTQNCNQFTLKWDYWLVQLQVI